MRGQAPSSLRLRLLCSVLLSALLCVQVRAHGYMSQPASRNFVGSPRSGRNLPVITYTPHGGNGRGKPAANSKHEWH